MKTLTHTFGLSLIFSIVILLSNPSTLQAKSLADYRADSSKVKVEDGKSDPVTFGEFDFNFDDPFFFNDKITISVYNQHDELIFDGTFTKEQSQTDKDLREILKKSEFLLSSGNQYYYYLKQ